jgi:hypothetical protein
MGQQEEQAPPAVTREAPQVKPAPGEPIVVKPQPTVEELETWRQTMHRTARPKNGQGCFTATYPDTTWHEETCKTPPHKLYPPKRPGMIRPETVGGAGPDFSAVVTGHITEAEGSFDSSTTGVTSECEVQCPNQVCPSNPTCTSSTGNQYSLQLNSAPFTTSTCSGSPDPASCQGWEQFVYSSGGGASIQYWLLDYGPAGTQCPTPRGATCTPGYAYSDGWCPFQFTSTGPVYCVVNAASSAAAPAAAITSLSQEALTGAAAGVNGNTNDSIGMTISGSAHTAPGGNYFPDLGNQWQEVEFNVFGDGNGAQAVFNSGATVHVRTGVISGTTSGPGCDEQGFTGESNNMTLGNTPPPAVTGTMPALLSWQSDPAPSGGSATCADATSVGDTHVTTFDGLKYDFQASGDFVLLDNANFKVQARQASGAPAWPDAAVNKAIAIQMGNTRVEIGVAPAQLLIDGKATNLADGKLVLQPTGVQVTRHGNEYHVTDLGGDSVRATLNTTTNNSWIETTVGLGKTPAAEARGLLGNPAGNAQQLTTAKGEALKEPVSFTDLYSTYGESWRVAAGESLFTTATTIKPGIPTKPLFASDLDPAAAARSLAACKAAGITNQELLDDCTLDTTVLNDVKAVKVFTVVREPIHVIRPAVLKVPMQTPEAK